MNTPDHTIEINALVKRFATHQQALGLTNARFAARYKQFVGSLKTWGKLKDGTWPGHINADRQLEKLKKFAGQLDGARIFDVGDFLSSMPIYQAFKSRFELLLNSTKDIRGMIFLGPQGVGKSYCASGTIRQAEADGEKNYFYLRLLGNYREKKYKIACEILLKLGGTLPQNPGDIMNALIAHAQSLGEFVLFVDEAHNGGVALLSILKDLIDETSIRFVYMAYATIYDQIIQASTGAVAESRQTLRRCLEPIFDEYRDGIMPHDVEAYLAGQGFPRNQELRLVAEKIQPYLAARYNLSTLFKAVDAARNQAEEQAVPFALSMVTDRVMQLCRTSGERRADLIKFYQSKAA